MNGVCCKHPVGANQQPASQTDTCLSNRAQKPSAIAAGSRSAPHRSERECVSVRDDSSENTPNPGQSALAAHSNLNTPPLKNACACVLGQRASVINVRSDWGVCNRTDRCVTPPAYARCGGFVLRHCLCSCWLSNLGSGLLPFEAHWTNLISLLN
jgi:hypothetical protein